ncbi:MAG TPA: FmdB family zinc ribbon protein [Atribacteraceae bacterium]|nr:FmdB family zinc ribbon protein [Atribacteraceae bacterium]
MPIYEYQCRECDNAFEELQSMNDQPLSRCPACGGRVKRLISKGVGFVFKGSGFYVNDYRPSAASTAGSGSSCGSCLSGSCSSCGSGGAEKGNGAKKTTTAKTEKS